MNITIVGTGYVGLVVGACLAETGNDVACADVDARKIDGLKQNVLPIYEPGLESLVERNQQQGRLKFTTDIPAAIGSADVIFIAVGTPPAGTCSRSPNRSEGTCAGSWSSSPSPPSRWARRKRWRRASGNTPGMPS